MVYMDIFKQLLCGGLMQFIAFDLETTGTVAGMDSIVEIGAIRFDQGIPVEMFCTLVDPQRSIPLGAQKVNGISDEMVQGQPLIKELLEPFADFCGDTPLIAHNASFDAQFLSADIKKYETRAPRGIVLDTLPMSRKVFPGLANYKLGTLVQHLKITSSQFHRAQEDAMYCGQLFNFILKKVSPRGELVPIDNLVTLSGKTAYYFPQITPRPKQMSFLEPTP